MILTDLLNAASTHPAITTLIAMFLAATFSIIRSLRKLDHLIEDALHVDET